MLKRRVIPVVLLRDGSIVQSRGFKRFQVLGNPTAIVRRLSEWAADELIYLDISRSPLHAPGRLDTAARPATDILDILRGVARCCFMPLAFGGGIRTLADIEARLLAGADKVVLNSQALLEPDLITRAARRFGSQAIIVSLDARAEGDGWQVYSQGGRQPSGRSPAAWAREAQDRGAGEVFVTSIDRDGAGNGYDLDLLRSVTTAVSIPVIACGGVGAWDHLAEGLRHTGVSAVAAANIFHHSENSVPHARRFLLERGLPVRPPTLHDDLPCPSFPA